MNVDTTDLQRIYRMLVIFNDADTSGAVAEDIMKEMNFDYQEYAEYIEWARGESEELLKMMEKIDDNG